MSDHDMLIKISGDVEHIRRTVDDVMTRGEGQRLRVDVIETTVAVHGSKIHDLRLNFWKGFWSVVGLLVSSGGLVWFTIEEIKKGR